MPRFLIVLFVLLAACSSNQQVRLKSQDYDFPITIENKINRGTDYQDKSGKAYNLRYIPIEISNDSTVSIQIEFEFSKEYYFPKPNDDEAFKLFPMPQEWAQDGIDVSEQMLDELAGQIIKPVLKKTIAPGGQFLFAIGALYPKPPRSTGVLPRTLFIPSAINAFPDCDNPYLESPSTRQVIPLGLKIIFGDQCSIIPCGKILYLHS